MRRRSASCWAADANAEVGGRKLGNKGSAPNESQFINAQSYHPGGANFLFADGSVHFLKSSINPIPWRALATRNYGEVISADSY